MKLDSSRINDQVKKRFAEVATRPEAEKRFKLGRTSAVDLGYDPSALDSLPPEAVASFAGVGNPIGLSPITEGMSVLDLGCGSGVDTMILAQQVGPQGNVVGIDMTDEMVIKARRAAKELGFDHVKIKKGTADQLDVESESIDVVTTNGLVNLCPDKEQVVREIYRVLKPDGRLQAADMSLVDGVNPDLLERIGEWSD